MFKYLLKIVVVVVLFYHSSLNAVSQKTPLQPVNCVPALQSCVVKILQIPESRDLIARVQQEGPINVVSTTNALAKQFGAYWDIDYRTIYIHLDSHRSEGEIMASILFELHNAASSTTFDRIDQLAKSSKMSKKEYIRAIEYIEYKNSLKTAKLAKKGIDKGIFSPDVLLPTYKSFEEHFRIQQEGGHSDQIAQTYDKLSKCG